ncbi:hypothetical protein PAXINDRAFT_37274, partial [Paxillus involutus ATCC 200175]
MQSLSSTQKNTILTRLDSGCSAHTIASTTSLNVSTIFIFHAKEHSDLQKSSGDHLSKLSPANVHHAIHFISTHRAENAVQVTKSLTNIINQPLHPNTVCQHLNKTGIKAVVKQKYPILSTRHYKAQLDFAYAHK